MEKNDLLNLLIAGGIAFAIALSGAGLGVALNKGKSSTEKSGGDVNSGVLGLYGGYKTLGGKELKAGKQAVLGLEIGDTKAFEIVVDRTTVADAKEFEIVDLSTTAGNIDWIKTQLKQPNIYTSTTDKKALYESGYSEIITFNVKAADTLFNTKNMGVFAVNVSIKHTAYVAKTSLVAEVTESWDFQYQLVNLGSTASAIVGKVATKTPLEANSDVFKVALVDAQKISDKGIDVLYWKKGAEALEDGTNFEVAIILDKKTGKVFYFTTVAKKYLGISVTAIGKITTTLR